MDSDSTVLSLLEAGACDYLLRNDGSQEKIGVLKGKILGLLFSANGSRLCQSFIQKLIPIYRDLNAKGQLEILFISDDKSEGEFKASLVNMPWLAVPFSNRQTEALLTNNFRIARIPSLVVIGADGKQVLTRHGEKLVFRYGAKAFPFTRDHIAALEKNENERALEIPALLKHPRHVHPLVLTDDPYDNQGLYGCDLCGKEGYGWSYHCGICSYDLHPTCVNQRYDLSAPIAIAPVPTAPVAKAPIKVGIADEVEKVKRKAPIIGEEAAKKDGKKEKIKGEEAAKALFEAEEAAKKDGKKEKIKGEVAFKAPILGEEAVGKKEKIKGEVGGKAPIRAEEAVGKKEKIKGEVVAVTGKVAEKIKGEATAIAEKVAGTTEKLKGEVAGRTEKLKGEVALQTEKLKGEVALQTEKLKGEVALQTEKLKSDLAGKTQKLKDDLAGKTQKLKGDLAGKTEKLKGEVAGKTEKLKGEVAGKTAAIGENVAHKKEKVVHHIMAKKNEWLLILLTVIFIILALIHLFWRIVPPSLKRKLKHDHE